MNVTNSNFAVLDRMQSQISDWDEKKDPRVIFLTCYRMMTANMLEAIRQGRFRDRAWVETLLHRFAEYYFDALLCYDCTGGVTPPVWHYVHETVRRKNLHVLQNLLLGINAHINYDLVLTVVDMLEPEWPDLTQERRQHRYADHCRVNDIIAETIDKVQDEVVERHDPMMDVIDRFFGRLDERLLSRLITRWREEVWEEAARFLECSAGEEREKCRRELEQRVLKRANQIALDF